MSLRVALCALAFVLAAPRAAEACWIDSVTPVTFGDYDVYASQPVQGTGQVVLKCVLSLVLTVDIGPGGGTVANRRLARTGGGTPLAYNLYSTAARTQVWGNGTAGTYHFVGVLAALGIPVPLTIFATLPARQDAAAGTYTDTVVVTLNY